MSHKYESVTKIARRWQRRYRRKGYGQRNAHLYGPLRRAVPPPRRICVLSDEYSLQDYIGIKLLIGLRIIDGPKALASG